MTADDPQTRGDRRVEEFGHRDGAAIEGGVV
jgi:hypothetical protein